MMQSDPAQVLLLRQELWVACGLFLFFFFNESSVVAQHSGTVKHCNWSYKDICKNCYLLNFV